MIYLPNKNKKRSYSGDLFSKKTVILPHYTSYYLILLIPKILVPT